MLFTYYTVYIYNTGYKIPFDERRRNDKGMAKERPRENGRRIGRTWRVEEREYSQRFPVFPHRQTNGRAAIPLDDPPVPTTTHRLPRSPLRSTLSSTSPSSLGIAQHTIYIYIHTHTTTGRRGGLLL